MRKIGLYEGGLILFIIITIGQYLFAWAAYLEKKYTAVSIVLSFNFSLNFKQFVFEGTSYWFQAKEIAKEKQGY